MKERLKRLPDAELEVMLVVWKEESPINSSWILEQLFGQRKWALATLMTVLSRLTQKGFLICEKKGRNNLYHAAVGEEEYKQNEGKSILEKLYGNSFKNLVIALYNSKAIDKGDIREICPFFEKW
ncbi:MAG: CopY family transcriptional regulator [Clostridiales bacterium 43-6]|nr:MAG: CopY family transcriptional regulator [Clostridiales bacterium 43-6]